jgi:hypothetical protein
MPKQVRQTRDYDLPLCPSSDERDKEGRHAGQPRLKYF